MGSGHFRATKSKMMISAGREGTMKEKRHRARLWTENLKGRDQLEDLGADGRIILM
jgi:hypothetical protein